MSRKQKMKVYHGVPKSIVDEHTIFYADFDGNWSPSIGTIDKTNNSNSSYEYKSGPTGYYPTSGGTIICTTTNATNVFTIDMFVPKFPKVSEGNKNIMTLKNSAGNDLVHIQVPSKCDYLALVTVENRGWQRLSNSQEDCFIRIVVNNGNVSNYINGKKLNQNPKIDMSSFNKIRMELHPSLWQGMCDLHISNIDRGDYFSNLPQDFIDGKAIIKPRMGQQQIKGDPMYSQVTTLKVPCTGQNSGWDIPVDNNMTQSSINPEVSVSSSEYTTGEKIRIKSLNGEIIGGIIDSDTALATVIKESTSGDSPDIITYLDDVSKFEVNDTVNILRPNNTIMGNHTGYTITEIDKINKSVKLKSVGIKTVLYHHCKLIETTTSSSSPLVKTNDGQTVKGAWTGLGTNVATFTLSDNTPSLQGKDLYVEYALTMPCGNSDFSELPHTVEKAWGENGVEMNPVNTITIVDDFKGKIKGSTKECPHFMGWKFSDTLQIPSNFTENDAQEQYNHIASINSLTRNCTTNKQNEIPQQMFSFNLIEIVERKLGCKISYRDKVQWIKDHFESVRVYYTGYGTNHAGNKAQITIFDQLKKEWITDWVTITTPSPSTKNGAFVYEHYDRIIPNGILYVLAYTGSSNGNVSSTIYTNYISVEVKLKTDSTYTTLYCENTRAREDKCNPVLVQKQTKTVKRYLPSRECFTTECKYVDMKRTKLNTDGELLTKLYENGKIYSTTQGSGSYLTHTASRYKNITNILKLEAIHPYTFYNESLYRSPLLNLMTFSNQLTDTNINNGTNTKFMPIECYDIPRYLVFKPYISIHDNEIRLYIYSSLLTKNTTSTQYTHSASLQALHVYDIPNRPLIK